MMCMYDIMNDPGQVVHCESHSPCNDHDQCSVYMIYIQVSNIMAYCTQYPETYSREESRLSPPILTLGTCVSV